MNPLVVSRAMTNRRLLLALVAVCVLSVPAFCTTFLTDMDTYAHQADKLLRGGVLYRDTIDTKPPMAVLQYAAVFAVAGGTNVAAVKVLTILVLIVSALLVRRVYSDLFLGRDGANLAAVLFVLGSFGGFGGDFLSSNTEIPANLFILLGVWAMVSDRFAYRPARLLLAGASVGVAFLYRYQAGAPLAAYFFLLILKRRDLDRPIRRLAALAVGFLAPIAVLIGYYLSIGAIRDLLLLPEYDFFYLRGATPYWPTAALLVVAGLLTVLQLLIPAGAGAADVVRRRRVPAPDAFLLLYLAISLGTFAIGSRFFGHYLIAALPPLALLAAAHLSRIGDAPAPRTTFGRALRRYERHAVAFLSLQVAAFFMVNLAYFVTRPPEPRYPDLARIVRAHTTRTDRIFVWTTKTHLLFGLDRTYATRFLSNDFLVGRMYGTRNRLPTATADSARPAEVHELWPILMSDLRASPPKLIIDDTPEDSRFTLGRFPPLRSFVERDYGPCVRADGFCVYIRKGA